MDNKKLETAIAEFVGAFEIVFRYDWPYTKDSIGDEKPGATFIEPGLDDEMDDWAGRGCLLEKYRRLVSVMQERGMEPAFPFPVEHVPNFSRRVW